MKFKNMSRWIILIGVLVICTMTTEASNIDSLKNQLSNQTQYLDRQQTLKEICFYYNYYKTNNDDSLRHYAIMGMEEAKGEPITDAVLELMGKAAVSYYYDDPEEYFRRFKKAIQVSDSLKNYKRAARFSYNVTIRHNNTGQYDSALVYALKGEDYINRLDDQGEEQPKVKSALLSITSGVYKALGNFPMAIDYAHKTENYSLALKDSVGIQKAYLNLGSIYGSIQEKKHLFRDSLEDQKYKDMARKYMELGYNFSKEMPVFHQRGLEPMNLGLLALEERDTTQALKFMNEALEMGTQQKQWRVMINALNELALLDIEEGNLNAGLQKIRRCDSIVNYIQSSHSKMALLLVEAKYFAKKGQDRKAIQIMDEAEALAKAKQNKPNLRRVYLQRYEFLKERNRYKETLDYFEKYIALRDSLTSKSDLADISYLVKQNELLKQKNELNIKNNLNLKQKFKYRNQLFLAIFLGLLAISIGLIYWLLNRAKIERYEKRSINMEQRLLRSQMNPHFTFNTLGSIQNYLLQSGQTKKGAYYLAKFAKLMRQILSQSRSEVISIKEEIETLENYLTLQKLRFEDRFDFEITVDPEIDQNNTKVPPMMIQPIIENSIEHGKIHTVANGKVEIRFTENDGILKVVVEDNGIGRTASKEINKVKQHKSVSMDIIKERIAILRKKYGQLIKVEIKDKLSSGTEVIFDLPFIDH